MDDRDDGVIQEWLLLPSSDISEEEELGNEENEEDLVFDIIFNRGLEEQLEADGINLEEIRVAVSEGDNEFGDVEEQEAEDIQSASEIVTALPEEEDVSMADPDYMRPGPSTGRPIHRRGRGRRQENAPRVRRAVQRDRSPVSIWNKEKFISPNVQWEGTIPNPPTEAASKTPLDFFSMFINEEIIHLITEQTNLYAQQKGKDLSVTNIEIQQYIGILLHSGVVNVPQYRMYWAAETRYPAIAEVLPRNRFDDILNHFHLVDNTTRIPGDSLFKVRPLINTIAEACRTIPPEQNQSIDEHMIPFKGTSHMKQYVKKKPKKWGYKVFMRCGASGLMHDFSIYIGSEKTCGDYGLGFSGDIVVELCLDLPNDKGFKIFTDNWFTSIKLFNYLKEKGVWGTGSSSSRSNQSLPTVGRERSKTARKGVT
ncbi:piggyBac transposable element-derived protein 3-like [Homalodisca vitripennis]|uniref:piggyBac transposable element-derived protein 3-like n=1 Tax=Homalodisca vitripennis TaxID=197043 RepID=UPI001EEA131E|nr:piggyBac transposable element-derived protein 3-like [Homalodisca vitripennis]